jgi:hypothetical protein
MGEKMLIVNGIPYINFNNLLQISSIEMISILISQKLNNNCYMTISRTENLTFLQFNLMKAIIQEEFESIIVKEFIRLSRMFQILYETAIKS